MFEFQDLLKIVYSLEVQHMIYLQQIVHDSYIHLVDIIQIHSKKGEF